MPQLWNSLLKAKLKFVRRVVVFEVVRSFLKSVAPLFSFSVMVCEVCKTQEASVFLTQIIEGVMQKINLCEICAKTKGVHDPAGFALADLFLGLGLSSEIEAPVLKVLCPLCGFSQSDLKKQGRLGCAGCYDVFTEDLAVILKGMHRAAVHCGKVPVTFSKRNLKQFKIKELNLSLEKAVSLEQYEEAAQLRDELLKVQQDFSSQDSTAIKLETSVPAESSSSLFPEFLSKEKMAMSVLDAPTEKKLQKKRRRNSKSVSLPPPLLEE